MRGENFDKIGFNPFQQKWNEFLLGWGAGKNTAEKNYADKKQIFFVDWGETILRRKEKEMSVLTFFHVLYKIRFRSVGLIRNSWEASTISVLPYSSSSSSSSSDSERTKKIIEFKVSIEAFEIDDSLDWHFL